MGNIYDWEKAQEIKKQRLKEVNDIRMSLIHTLNEIMVYDLEKHKMMEFKDSLLKEITRLSRVMVGDER